MAFNFFKNIKKIIQKGKKFRNIKPDGEGFVYYPYPDFKGFKVASIEELNKIIKDVTGIYALFVLMFIYLSFGVICFLAHFLGFKALYVTAITLFSCSVIGTLVILWRYKR